MGIIKDKDRDLVQRMLRGIEHRVNITVFTQTVECQYCEMTRQLVEEVASLNDNISVAIKDFVADSDLADGYGVDKIPAVVVEGDKDYGIRFFGIPSGYEFTSFVEAIADVGRRDPGLPTDIVARLSQITAPIHMQAMVTPSCPYCPQAVRTAHKFAMASDMIRADMVEVTEFPHLAVKYRVSGVPNTIVNEEHSIMGGLAVKAFAERVLEIAGA